MDAPAVYVQLGFLVISVPNLLIVVGMVVLFVVALVAPFPVHGGAADDEERGG